LALTGQGFFYAVFYSSLPVLRAFSQKQAQNRKLPSLPKNGSLPQATTGKAVLKFLGGTFTAGAKALC
jgi:hypothetical protein